MKILFDGVKSRKLFALVCEQLNTEMFGQIKISKFREMLGKKFDENITGGEQTEYKITSKDINDVLVELGYVKSGLLNTKLL